MLFKVQNTEYNWSIANCWHCQIFSGLVGSKLETAEPRWSIESSQYFHKEDFQMHTETSNQSKFSIEAIQDMHSTDIRL